MTPNEFAPSSPPSSPPDTPGVVRPVRPLPSGGRTGEHLAPQVRPEPQNTTHNPIREQVRS